MAGRCTQRGLGGAYSVSVVITRAENREHTPCSLNFQCHLPHPHGILAHMSTLGVSGVAYTGQGTYTTTPAMVRTRTHTWFFNSYVARKFVTCLEVDSGPARSSL